MFVLHKQREEREDQTSHGHGPEVGGRGGRGRDCLPRCCLPRNRVVQRRGPTAGGNSVSKKVNIKYIQIYTYKTYPIYALLFEMLRSEAINQMRTNGGNNKNKTIITLS